MKKSGILFHASSLPSDYGIGSFGRQAYNFIDFLASAGQHFWQLLPLGPTSYGDSPYQSLSTFAGNPYFIDLDELASTGLLLSDDYKTVFWGDDETLVDYAVLYDNRYPVLKAAYSRFLTLGEKDSFLDFCVSNAEWLDDYSLYMAIKNSQGGRSWHEWDAALRLRDSDALSDAKERYADDIGFYKFLQYEFFSQWNALKKYANEKGIQIIGDLPIYVADDSADTWANPALFDLNPDGIPNHVAGCPPDYFSEDGQLWGNPVYNWSEHERTGYSWWIKRLAASFAMYDVVRIDHFRGFAGFYSIPYGEKTAKNGKWEKGPAMKLFNAAKNALGSFPVIAEDLGVLTPDVTELLEASGFPGMKVLHFVFGSDEEENDSLPRNIKRNCVVYAGTHDNTTTKDWISTVSQTERDNCLKYMKLDEVGDDFVRRFIEMTMDTDAMLAVITMQDYLELGGEARMNEPSTLSGNWQWRARKSDLSGELAARIKDFAVRSGRANA